MLEKCTLSFGGGIYGHHCNIVTLPDGIDDDDARALINKLRISIKDSKIIDNKGSGIFALNCRITTINTEISNNTGHGIDIEHRYIETDGLFYSLMSSTCQIVLYKTTILGD